MDTLNLAGLGLNAIGALLLVLFTSSNLDVTKTGESFISFFNSPPPEQRTANLKRHCRHSRGFKIGFWLLLVGYGLQIAAALDNGGYLGVLTRSDYYLKCDGSTVVTNFVVGSTPMAQSHQQIAVHVKDRTISFSGNSMFGRDDVQICPPGTLGIAAGDSYFDSDNCHGKVKAKERIYGTYNRVTQALQVSSEKNLLVVYEGSFACALVDIER